LSIALVVSTDWLDTAIRILVSRSRFDLDLNDRLEIESQELGTTVWIVENQPQLLRRKRSIIGKTATVVQIVDM